MPKKKFSAKQLAAQKRFAAMARSGAFKRGKSRSKPTASAAVKTGGNTMAKRRGRKGFSRVGRFAARAAGSDVSLAVGGFAYGYTRAWISKAVKPLTDQIPIGGILADNLVLGLGAWGLKRYTRIGKMPLAKNFLTAVIVAESMLAGVDVYNNGFGNLSPQAPKVVAAAEPSTLRVS